MIDCVIKLVSGEELFSGIANVEGDIIVLDEPMKIAKHYNDTGRGVTVQLNFEPFMDYNSTKSHPIKRQHIISCEPLIPRLCELYTEMKTSLKTTNKSSTNVQYHQSNTIH